MRHAWLLRLLPLVLLLPTAPPTAFADPPVALTPTSAGIEITRDTRLAPGEHLVEDHDGPGVLIIRTDGVTLDLGRATLHGAPRDRAPDEYTGVGILVENAKDVTIRNGGVTGFRVGIRAVNAPGLEIQDVDASGGFRQRLKSTPEREDTSDWLWPHHNDENEWETRYGAAFSLTGCEGATVHDCRARRGQNGLLLTRCTRCYAYDNDFSFHSGWGIALYRTSHTEVAHNVLDFCVRGTSHGVYHRGQDSAAILVFEQCHHNLFYGNHATHSGDGFFLYAGHETTQRTGQGGCNHNMVLGNDFRFAVANGIEATFSEENHFEHNRCSGCDHGIWAGYSRKSTFAFNELSSCLTAGLSIEHGTDNVIRSNRALGARYGIHLWWDEDKQFLESVYGTTQDCASARNVIQHNQLQGTTAALRLWGDVDSKVRDNRFGPGDVVLDLGAGTRLAAFQGNRFDADLEVVNTTGAPFAFDGTNELAGRLTARGDPVEELPAAEAPAVPVLPRLPRPRDVRGHVRSTPWGEGGPQGREQMRIDEWGPLDPRETSLFPAEQSAAGASARLYLVGQKSFRVKRISAGVTVEPREGRAPATLVVTAAQDGLLVRPFEVIVEVEGRELRALGTLTSLRWEVQWFAWDDTCDPRTDRPAFTRRLAGTPVATKTVRALDFPWQGTGPEGLGPDRFATRARARIEVAAPGRYRLRVVSDDGVRVQVNERTVIERWDRHGPTEDVAEITLEKGENEILIHHFEIDGWAWLSCRLEGLP